MYRIFRYSRGLTLLELLIAVVLISVLLGAVWTVYHAGFKVFYAQGKRSGIKGEAGRWLINMPAELRMAGVLAAAGQSSITFTLDTDDNGADETVQYLWSGVPGEPLNRMFTSIVPAFNTTVPAVNSVNNLSFSYYGGNNTLLSFPVTASQVRMIAINITVSADEEAFLLRSNVRLRSF